MTIDERSGVLTAVLQWVRSGYPGGLVGTEWVALITFLQTRLTDPEVDQVVRALAVSGQVPIDPADTREAIADAGRQPLNQADLLQVASRLAGAGWPLVASTAKRAGNAGSDTPEPGGESSGLVRSVIGWLRAGYPQGIPENDYIPLLALLQRRLSDDEIAWVANQVVAQEAPPFGTADIGALITRVTDEMPSEADINRVQLMLQDGGWPVVPARVATTEDV